jgi:LEA14-like dessication related protein
VRLTITLLLLALLGNATPLSAAKRQPIVVPRITVQNVLALSSSTPQRFRVTLLIDNVNAEPLEIKRLDFKLRLAEEGIVDGVTTAPLTVAALDSQQLTLELSSDIISSLSRLLAFVQGPANTLHYDIYGRVTLNRRKELPFATSGQAPLAMSSER